MVVSREPTLESYFEPQLRRALDETGVPADAHLEHYLVHLLAQQGLDAPPDTTLVDMELAARNESTPPRRCHALRRLGDHTLFTSGMFEERLGRRGVSARYYRDKGSSAYAEAAGMASRTEGKHAATMRALARRFDEFVAVLRKVRQGSHLSPAPDAHALLVRAPHLHASLWRSAKTGTTWQ